MEESESGFIGNEEAECYVGAMMRDVEVIHIKYTNIIARGKRYGRQWLLKGLRQEFRDSTVMRRRLIKEFELHSRLRHPNIVQAVGLEEIEGLGLCIVQEWVEGPTLAEAIRENSLLDPSSSNSTSLLTSSERRRIMHELVDAAAYLHRNGIVHRDIKPANVIIRDTGKEPVLIDFGLADSDDYVEIKQAAGTPGYVSPEQQRSEATSPTDDIYSLGVMMASLTPRYRKIANRCMGAVGKRPKDGTALQKALARRDRLPKVIVAIIGVIILVGGGGVLGWRLFDLESTHRLSKENIRILSRKNAENEARVTNLKDSLNRIEEKFASTNDELNQVKQYEAMRQNIYAGGYGRIDKILKEHDRTVFSKMTPEDKGIYSDKTMALQGELQNAIEDYCASLHTTSLSAEDREKIRMDLYNYQTIKLAEYFKKWMKRIYP